jgi:hypothetical protein
LEAPPILVLTVLPLFGEFSKFVETPAIFTF